MREIASQSLCKSPAGRSQHAGRGIQILFPRPRAFCSEEATCAAQRPLHSPTPRSRLSYDFQLGLLSFFLLDNFYKPLEINVCRTYPQQLRRLGPFIITR